MIVIGTAGHIDHGKSSIVKLLTGTDPDRLPEEKKRGMTIDLGFAFYKTANSDTIAFVDVPGHERFIKNMISGAGGIDAVILVVAADDGWMPQTEEHFQIVRLLGIKKGIIVINKCDLADAKTLKALRTDISQRVGNSFLDEAQILEVSAATGTGFDELKKSLDELSIKVKAGLDIGKARLYIDRVFVRPGIGAVTTGTLKDGSLSVGDKVNIWPSNKSAKIKSLQSNNQNVNKANPSQRTAVSLSGIDKSELIRGGVVTRIEDLEFFVRNPVLALKIELLNSAPVAIENKRRAVLLVGTSETEGELRLFSGVSIGRGQTGIVFFKPKAPLFTLVGDRVILRLPSPSVTLGGGVVLDHLKSVPNQKDIDKKNYLQSRDVAFLEQLILSELVKSPAVKEGELLKHTCRSKEEIKAVVDELLKSSRLGMHNGYIFEKQTFENASKELLHIIDKLFASKKSVTGLTLKEIAKAGSMSDEIASLILQILVNRNELVLDNELYRPIETQSSLPPAIQTAYNNIMSELKKSPYMPPELEKLASKGKFHKEAIRLMLKSGEIHKCGQEFVFLSSVWKEIESFIIQTLRSKQELKVGELRDKFKFTRKYAIPILEETDKIRLTKRQGDVRVRGENIEK